MTLQRKTYRLGLVASLLVLTAGCSGIHAGKSISPMDFILPGLLHNAPPPANPTVTTTNSVKLVAQVR